MVLFIPRPKPRYSSSQGLQTKHGKLTGGRDMFCKVHWTWKFAQTGWLENVPMINDKCIVHLHIYGHESDCKKKHQIQ